MFFVFSNKYHLKAFPFDSQQLSIKIGDRNEYVERLNFYYDVQSVAALDKFVKNNDMVEWTVKSAEMKSYHDIYDLTPGIEIVLNIDPRSYIFPRISRARGF